MAGGYACGKLVLVPDDLHVVAAVIEREGRFLVGKRSEHKRSAAGYWSPIIGQIEPGETEEQAVAREVEEEVGLVVEPVTKVGVWWARDRSARIHWWRAQIVDGDARCKNDEHSEIRWVTVEEMRRLDPVFEGDISVFESCSREQSPT